MRSQVFAASVLILFVAVAASVQAQVPTSLKETKSPLTFTPDNKLVGNTSAAAAACAPRLASVGAPALPGVAPATKGSQDYTWTPDLGNVSHYYPDGDIAVSLLYRAENAAATGATSGMIVYVNATVGSNITYRAPPTTVATSPSAVPSKTDHTLVSAAPINDSVPKDTPLIVKVEIIFQPGPHNIALSCGVGQSQVVQFNIIKGQVADDGDVDGDGDPDSSDLDIDGDSVPNSQERLACTFNGQEINFAREPIQSSGSRGNHDGDRSTDEEECANGTNPISASSFVPEPPGVPWGLIIVGIVLLLILAFVVYFFMSLGKAVEVNVISPKELIVPPGGEGRFEVLLTNLKKKGNAINFQLAATGMPDGWDAKLTTDHVILDARNGAKPQESVWLIVESPEHTDPESAVVTIKAIPLSKSGRKDTLKLAGRDRVITSINVPPNAKVPVTRGAPVQMKSEKELAQEASQPAPTPTLLPPTGVQPLAASEPTPSPEPVPKKGRKGKAQAPTPETVPTPSPTATPAKPQVQVGGLQHAPLTFKRGDEVKSSVTVTNNGNDPQTLKLSLFVNEALADAQTVSVKPGKTKQVQFKWQAQERNKLNIRGELVTG